MMNGDHLCSCMNGYNDTRRPKGSRSSYVRLVRYLLDPKNTQERVGRVTISNCHSDDVTIAALEVEAHALMLGETKHEPRDAVIDSGATSFVPLAHFGKVRGWPTARCWSTAVAAYTVRVNVSDARCRDSRTTRSVTQRPAEGAQRLRLHVA